MHDHTPTPADLVAAWQTAQELHEQTRQLATRLAGDLDGYRPIRIAAATARDNYAKWADVLGHDAVAEQIRDLGRHMRAYLTSLPDQVVYGLAVRSGFPAIAVYAVSADALRWWLDAAYPDDHPRKTHVKDEAVRRAAQHGTLHASLYVIFTG